MDNNFIKDDYIFHKELCEIDCEINYLENINLEYHKKIEENNKKLEELKKQLQEKKDEIKKNFQRLEEAYSVTVEAHELSYINYENPQVDFLQPAACARYEQETKMIQELIYEVDSEGQTDKLPPKKSKWDV